MRSHETANVPVISRNDSRLGTVVGAREESVRAGLDMLERGGNAVDAAVAAALVAGVIEPTETTLAGSGFLLYGDLNRDTWCTSFGPKAPLAAHANMFELHAGASGAGILGIHPVVGNVNVDGPRASGVPRTLLGLLKAQEAWGVLHRVVVCTPAIEAAYNGFAPDSWFVLNAVSDLGRLRSDPTATDVFLDADGLPKGRTSQQFYGGSFAGSERVTQAALGATLELVANAPLEELVDGSIAARMVESSRELGGILSVDDFRAAAPDFGRARRVSYRDAEVFVPNAPGGGITELQILKVWERLTPQMTTSHGSPELTRLLALAIRHAFADRYHWLGDPAVVPVPESELLDDSYVQTLAEACLVGDVPGWSDDLPWRTFAGCSAHNPWAGQIGVNVPPAWIATTASTATSGTTHISATDTAGRTVSITHTAANHFGNGIVCPRTGLLFDSAMAWFNAVPGAANSISGGARPLANMGPAIVRDATRDIALGASGGRRIISAVAQVIINLVDGGMSASDALAAPRIDGSGKTVSLPESRSGAAAELEDLGYTLLPTLNDPYALDYARPNLAIHNGGSTSSAIEFTHYGN